MYSRLKNANAFFNSRARRLFCACKTTPSTYTDKADKFKQVDYDLVRLLLQNGANPNLNNGVELFHAIKYDFNELFLLLIQYNADINLVKYETNRMTDNEIVQVALDHGFNLVDILRIKNSSSFSHLYK